MYAVEGKGIQGGGGPKILTLKHTHLMDGSLPPTHTVSGQILPNFLDSLWHLSQTMLYLVDFRL
jgi:hypothetical protein